MAAGRIEFLPEPVSFVAEHAASESGDYHHPEFTGYVYEI